MDFTQEAREVTGLEGAEHVLNTVRAVAPHMKPGD
jgi:hypothetical protein